MIGVLLPAAITLIPIGALGAGEQPPLRHVVVLAVPMAVARALPVQNAAYALGVFPDSRSPRAFLNEIVAGAPEGPSRLPPDRTGSGALADLLLANGVAINLDLGPGTEPGGVAPNGFGLTDAFAGSRYPDLAPARAVLDVIETTDPAYATTAIRARAAGIVLGVGQRTPVLVMATGWRGVLKAPDTGRAGVVTPYDVTATILRILGIEPGPHVAGGSMGVVSEGRPLVVLDALAGRFERDAGYGPGASGMTAGMALLGVFAGAGALALRRRRVAEAFSRAASLVPGGYLVALFVPSARWEVRSIPIVVAFLCGLLAPSRGARRFCGVAVLATAGAIGVLTVLAPLRPGAEPALSLWGDPLTSWRFFGLRNHLAAFVAGGAVVGPMLLDLPVLAFAASIVFALVIVGAPALGANYIGVLTLGLGASFALLARARGTLRAWYLIASGAVGIGAASLALLADAGSPASHGGRAAHSISSEGVVAVWRIMRARAVLNYREVAGVGFFGFVGFIGTAVALTLLFAWAFRSREVPVPVRAGVAGIAAAAFAALFVEDSGFFTGAILALFPWLGFATYHAGARAELRCD